jgi:hypothetical protein
MGRRPKEKGKPIPNFKKTAVLAQTRLTQHQNSNLWNNEDETHDFKKNPIGRNLIKLNVINQKKAKQGLC